MDLNRYHIIGLQQTIRELTLNEISDIICEACEAWKGARAAHKIAAIEGIMNMAAAMDEYLSEELATMEDSDGGKAAEDD
jgi:hypothetical protein